MSSTNSIGMIFCLTFLFQHETDTLNNQTKAKTISDLESRCQDLHVQIQSLNNVNSLMTDKVARLESEKSEVMQRVPAPGEVIRRTEYDQ